MQKTQIKLKIGMFLEFWVVFPVSSFVCNPVYSNQETFNSQRKTNSAYFSFNF